MSAQNVTKNSYQNKAQNLANKLPLVSVICLSFNHEKYVAQALHSVLSQTYPNIEIIVVDDASTDNSRKVIQEFVLIHPNIKFLPFSKNIGNCTAFNTGFQLSKGKYIVDFATDDLMYPERIEQQVNLLEEKGKAFGVAFSDADMIDENGNKLSTYYQRDKLGKLKKRPPEGEVYTYLIKRQFICTPTMMIRRKVLEELGGYDEELVYEDYDFWVRSGRMFSYAFSRKVLTAKRNVSNSHGKNFYNENANLFLTSTLKVCKKAYLLNQSKKENRALAVSVRYHLRLSLFTQNFEVAMQFWQLLTEMKRISILDVLVFSLVKLKVPLFRLYQIFRKFKR